MAETPRPWYRWLWDGWMVVARAIGNFNARLVLSLIYFLIMLPLGLVAGAAKDFLGIRRRPASTWHPKADPPRTLEEGRRQF
ncbi:MAG: hypothetical protein ACE5KY_03170 [Candidatus Tectimicrobiota bacterium]